MELLHRPRRLRTSEAVREMARETRLSKKALVYPVFIREGSGIREEIPSLPGQYHYSPDTICEEMERLVRAGINKILLFGIPAHKDEMGSSAWDDNGAVQQAIREIKKKSLRADLLHHRRLHVRVHLSWTLRRAGYLHHR